jgi:hypothetical protein
MKTSPNPLRVGIGGPVGSGNFIRCEGLLDAMKAK